MYGSLKLFIRRIIFNRELLQLYVNCKSEVEVAKAQDEYIQRCEQERLARKDIGMLAFL